MMTRHLGLTALMGSMMRFLEDLVHQLGAEDGPGLVALGGDIGVGLGVGEVEVVEDNFVEVFGGEFGHGLDLGALDGVGVAEGLVAVGFLDGEAEAAGDLDAAVGEEFFEGGDGGVGGEFVVAGGFEVDLVDVDLGFDGGPLGGELGRGCRGWIGFS